MITKLATLDRKYVFHRQIFRSKDPGDYILRCHGGFLCQDGERIGYYWQTDSSRRLAARVRRIAKLPGSSVKQIGDLEFYGVFPVSALQSLLKVAKPYKRHVPGK
jgi:hypothetical protein